MLRTAEAAGAAGLICLGDAVDPHDPAVLGASMGAVPLLHLVRTRLGTLQRWCAAHDVALVAADPRADARWDRAALPDRRVLLLYDLVRRARPQVSGGSPRTPSYDRR